MEDKITIIEGPPPVFDPVSDSWSGGISESPFMVEVAVTRLRTFNGAALVERCHRAWRNGAPIHLEYRTSDGLLQSAYIIACRHVEINEGQLLVLWVRFLKEEPTLELGQEDEEDDGGVSTL